MTSQITTSNIDTLYPKAGQDNDSQGFRDNFANIATGLNVAKSEISNLQSNAVLTGSLGENPVAVENDMLGSSIVNGFYNNLHGSSYLSDAVSIQDINVDAGSVQEFTMANSVAFTFRNWPIDGKYAVVRVHLLSNGIAQFTPSFVTENGGDVVLESSFPSPFTVADTGAHQVIEAWSYNNGATVYIRYLGEF